MKIPNVTLKNGFSIPVIGKGTWMTNVGKKPLASLKDNDSIAQIKQALDSGISYLDTAERYTNGHTELVIGQAIKGYHRENLFLASKVSSDHLGYNDVVASAKSSIKRMHSSYIDLYLIHQFNEKVSLEETMKAMDYLIEKKLIKYIGVCNFTIEQIKKAQSYTKNSIVANQMHYNLMFRDSKLEEIVKYCQKNDIVVIAWRPFQKSLLTEKTIKILDEVAKTYKKTPMQIASAWLMNQPNVSVLGKFIIKGDIELITDATSIKLEKKDIEKLDEYNN